MQRFAAILPLRIRILQLLSAHPDGLHGYAIMRQLDVSNGSLYPALARLVGAGYLGTTEGPLAQRGDKTERVKVYVVTARGSEQLAAVRAQIREVPNLAEGFRPLQA